MQASIFVSYRRAQLESVKPVVAALRGTNIDVFLDVEDIDEFEDFPLRIRQMLSESHALLVWWSLDYAESEHCMHELRLAWQHARRQSSDLARRIWIVNPEPSAHHIFAGELDSNNFLSPPAIGLEAQWAQNLSTRAQRLLPEGPLADERPPLHAPRGLSRFVPPLLRGSANATVAPPIAEIRISGAPRPPTQFTGRGRELWKIHSLLHPAQIMPATSGPTVRIGGVGGVGKSELAAKYAAEFARGYPGGVFWLNFSGSERTNYSETYAEAAWLAALKASLSAHPWLTSGQLKLQEEGKDLPLAEVRNNLDRLLDGRPSLWVLDSVPVIRPEDLRDQIVAAWVAPNSVGRTIITTRDMRPFGDKPSVSLDVLQPEDALRLLARYRHPGTALAVARQLVDEVGAHTLALVILGHRLSRDKGTGGYASVLQGIRERGLLERVEELADWARDKLQLGDKVRGIFSNICDQF
jgi:hypothetical protein